MTRFAERMRTMRARVGQSRAERRAGKLSRVMKKREAESRFHEHIRAGDKYGSGSGSGSA